MNGWSEGALQKTRHILGNFAFFERKTANPWHDLIVDLCGPDIIKRERYRAAPALLFLSYPEPMSLSSAWTTWKARPGLFSLLLKWLLVVKSVVFGKKLPPTQDSTPAEDPMESSDVSPTSTSREGSVEATEKPYYNARLDPKNYLEGPLSTNPATRLRQLLARPGIIVSGTLPHLKSSIADTQNFVDCPRHLRRHKRSMRHGGWLRMSISEV